MHIMKLILSGLHHVQGFSFHQLHQLDHHILLQGLKRCIRLHLPYLLAIIMAILATKLVSATFLPRISFVIIVGKRDIRKLSILPSFRNESNSNYHGKIYQHLPFSLNQNPRNFNFSLKFFAPRVIPVRMIRRRSTMLTKRRCFKAMLLKFKLYKMIRIIKGPTC